VQIFLALTLTFVSQTGFPYRAETFLYLLSKFSIER